MPIKPTNSKCIVVVNVCTITIIYNMDKPIDVSMNIEEAKEKQKAALEKFSTELRKEQEKKYLAQWKKNNSQKLSNTLSNLNADDKAVCESFQKLSNTCGGDRQLSELFNVYLATKRMNS